MKNKLKQYIVILFVLVADIASASNLMRVDLSGVWQFALDSQDCQRHFNRGASPSVGR